MMSDLIKRADAIKALGEAMPQMSTPDGCGWNDWETHIACEAFADAIKIVEAIPPADGPQGEWIKKPHKVYLPGDYEPDIIDYRAHQYNEEDHSIIQYWWHCNQCDYEASRWSKPTANFCPDCGAQMKGESDEF